MLLKFRKFHRKIVVLKSFFHKETPIQVFPCEICEIFKNTYFEEHLRTTASEYTTSITSDQFPVHRLTGFYHGDITLH